MKFRDVLTALVSSYRSKRVKTGTVRYMFPAMLGTAVVLGASLVTSVSESYVYLVSDTSTNNVGDIFSVEVGVSAHTPINAVDILVEFPAENLEVVRVNQGQSVITLWTKEPVISTDSVQLVGGSFKRGFIGRHQIALIEFRVKQPGQVSIASSEVTLVAGDGTGNKVEVANNPASRLNLFTISDSDTFDSENLPFEISTVTSTDINGDGVVTLQDVSVFMAAWHNNDAVLDFDGDGEMKFKDLSIILADLFFR